MGSARTAALAAALLAASACVEREDPYGPGWSFDGDADRDGYASKDDCDDHDARAAFRVNAYRDADGDGIGGGVAQPVCAGLGWLPAGFVLAGGDCDDARFEVHAAARLYLDEDGDGVGSGALEDRCIGDATPPGWSAVGGDCAPRDAAAWRLLPFAARDADLDGYVVLESGEVCAGAALPAGHLATATAPLDCDDGDAARFRVAGPAFADPDGDGVGAGSALEVCAGDALPPAYAWSSGDCAPADPSAWQAATYLYVDGDRDGATAPAYGQLCVGAAGLPAGYLTAPSGDDCDDADAARTAWRWLLPDADGDGIGAGAAERLCTGAALPPGWAGQGEDCAPADATRWRAFPYTARDADGDTRTVAEVGTLCLDDGPPPHGYTTSTSGDDCDDGDPSVWARVSGYVDADADGIGVAPAIASCTAGTLPSGQVAAAGDCAADDASRWQVLSYAWVDRDGDAVTAMEAGQVCAGRFLPEPYRPAAAGLDCDDARADRWRWTVLYPDRDGDGAGAPPREITCLGFAMPPGFSLGGGDPDDADPATVGPRPVSMQVVY